MQLRSTHRPVLLLQLAAPLSLFSLNALSFRKWKHLLVLDPQLPALQFEMIQVINDSRSLLSGGEVRKRQTSEDAIVEVVIKGVRKRQVEFCHELNKLFLLYRKRDILDYDGRRNKLLIRVGVNSISPHRLAERNVAQASKMVHVRQRRLIKPSLQYIV